MRWRVRANSSSYLVLAGQVRGFPVEYEKTRTRYEDDWLPSPPKSPALRHFWGRVDVSVDVEHVNLIKDVI